MHRGIKLENGLLFPLHPCLMPLLKGNSLKFMFETSRKSWTHWATLRWKLHDTNFNRFWLIHPCDGRTDGQAIAMNKADYIARYSICCLGCYWQLLKWCLLDDELKMNISSGQYFILLLTYTGCARKKLDCFCRVVASFFAVVIKLFYLHIVSICYRLSSLACRPAIWWLATWGRTRIYVQTEVCGELPGPWRHRETEGQRADQENRLLHHWQVR